MKTKRSAILPLTIGTALGLIFLAMVFFLGKKYAPKLGNSTGVSQPANVKIKVDFVNSRRIHLTVFFPLDYHVVVPGTYTLQRKNERNQWEGMKVSWKKELENTLILTESIDEEKYPDIGFATEVFEFSDRYSSLTEGEYRVLFPMKITAKEEEHLLAVPFQISKEYECDAEPKDYEYIAATRPDTDFVKDYESCKMYITYDSFLSGFENYTFSRDMYEHMTKIILRTEEREKEIRDPDEMKKLYDYFASAVLSRADGEVFGGTFFYNMDQDARPVALDIPDTPDTLGQSRTVQFFFRYGRKEKSISCEINGHQMLIKTRDFAFDEEMVKSMPIGPLQPVDDGEERVMEYYIFNDIEQALKNKI